MSRTTLLSLVLVTLAACGGAPVDPIVAPVVPVASANPAPVAPPRLAALDLDPVAVALGSTTAGPAGDAAKARAGVVELCDTGLAKASSLIDTVRALGTQPDAALTWDSVLAPLDQARIARRNAGDFNGLMAVAHPDAATRELAKACEPKSEKLETDLWLDAKVAGVVKRYAAKHDTLSPVHTRFLERMLREFRRNGLDLDATKQGRIRELNARLTQSTQDFDSHIAAAHGTIEATPAELEGLPAEWLASHAPAANGKITVSTDYPDYFPVITYAKHRDVALALYKQFDNRAVDTNLKLLDQILAMRAEKASLLGYPTWADYVLEPRMAKNAKTVATFLEGLRTHVAKKGNVELAEFRAMKVKLGGKATDPIPPSDRLYLEDQVRKAKYGLDSKEVSQYFEVSNVKRGLLTITSRLFGVTYRPAAVPTWHPDVEAMEVLGADGTVLGRFYFDLHPREGKYKHAAVFSIRDTVKLPNGTRQLPIAAIECNFPRPTPGGPPALMSHQDAVTFFHEFGHVLHHLLSESELSTFAGTSVARDFVESPSQMLEEWAWAKETLDLFAVHHETGKPLPKKLYDAMVRSRSFGRAIGTQRQLFLAALDQAYHTRAPGFDTTKVLAEVNDAYTPFKYVEGTHFQASFGHLMGYDAGYYGYQWALSIAQDLFTRFRSEGMLNPKTAAEYRARVLAPGGSQDEAALVESFLGRAPNDAAYRAFLLKVTLAQDTPHHPRATRAPLPAIDAPAPRPRAPAAPGAAKIGAWHAKRF